MSPPVPLTHWTVGKVRSCWASQGIFSDQDHSDSWTPEAPVTRRAGFGSVTCRPLWTQAGGRRAVASSGGHVPRGGALASGWGSCRAPGDAQLQGEGGVSRGSGGAGLALQDAGLAPAQPPQ